MKTLLKIAKAVILLAAAASAAAFICERIAEIKNKGAEFLRKPTGLYERYVKRPLDCFLSTGALIVLSPLLLCLTVIGAVKMKGNPFFTQDRPGRTDPQTGKERIFKLIKFRSMTNERDENGELLPDDVRLNSYGKLLRSTSLDELPELLNIVKGDMAIVGPRPLLVTYLPWYTERERHRHDVRPGLTGLAQINGRNFIDWDNRLALDTEYTDSISFSDDISILSQTIKKVIIKENIAVDSPTAEPYLDEERKAAK